MQLTMLCQCFIYTEQIFSAEVLKFKKNFLHDELMLMFMKMLPVLLRQMLSMNQIRDTAYD